MRYGPVEWGLPSPEVNAVAESDVSCTQPGSTAADVGLVMGVGDESCASNRGWVVTSSSDSDVNPYRTPVPSPTEVVVREDMPPPPPVSLSFDISEADLSRYRRQVRAKRRRRWRDPELWRRHWLLAVTFGVVATLVVLDPPRAFRSAAFLWSLGRPAEALRLLDVWMIGAACWAIFWITLLRLKAYNDVASSAMPGTFTWTWTGDRLRWRGPITFREPSEVNVVFRPLRIESTLDFWNIHLTSDSVGFVPRHPDVDPYLARCEAILADRVLAPPVDASPWDGWVVGQPWIGVAQRHPLRWTSIRDRWDARRRLLRAGNRLDSEPIPGELWFVLGAWVVLVGLTLWFVVIVIRGLADGRYSGNLLFSIFGWLFAILPAVGVVALVTLGVRRLTPNQRLTPRAICQPLMGGWSEHLLGWRPTRVPGAYVYLEGKRVGGFVTDLAFASDDDHRRFRSWFPGLADDPGCESPPTEPTSDGRSSDQPPSPAAPNP